MNREQAKLVAPILNLFINDASGVPTVQIKDSKGGGIPCSEGPVR